MKRPFGLNAVSEFVKTILHTNNLRDDKAVSSYLVSPPDMGKTDIMMQYKGNESVMLISDATSWGITSLLQDSGGKLRTLLFTDLSALIEGKDKSSQATFARINSMIEEGWSNISTKFTSVRVGTKDKTVRMNIIGSITIHSFLLKRNNWLDLGLLSRIVPFFYYYNAEDAERIRQEGMARSHCKTKTELKAFPTPFMPIKVKVCKENKGVAVTLDAKYGKRLAEIAKLLAKINGDITGFRSQRNMICLAKAHALVRGDTAVNDDDLRQLVAWLPFWFFHPARKDVMLKNGDVKSVADERNSVYGACDCEYYIMLNLPNKYDDVASKLKPHYSDQSILEGFEALKKKNLITQDIAGCYNAVV